MEKIQYKLQHSESVTLIDIKEQKQLVLKQIRDQQKNINKRAENIISPITDTGSTLMNSFNLGMVAFDTIMLGVRSFRRIARFFRRRR